MLLATEDPKHLFVCISLLNKRETRTQRIKDDLHTRERTLPDLLLMVLAVFWLSYLVQDHAT